FAVHRIGDRRRVDAGTDVEAPDLLQGPRVVRRERAVDMADEHEVAGGRERARVVRILELQRDLGLAGERIDRLEAALEPVRPLRPPAGEAVARLHRAALIREVLLLDSL